VSIEGGEPYFGMRSYQCLDCGLPIRDLQYDGRCSICAKDPEPAEPERPVSVVDLAKILRVPEEPDHE